jgi:hypothetical protein
MQGSIQIIDMQLPEPHLSPNRWIAQIEKDFVLINPMFHDKGKFVVICWNPKGLMCNKCKIFGTPEEAQTWVESLDQYTQQVITKHGKAIVFICGNGEYWWSREEEGKQKYSPLYQIVNMEHAIGMVKCTLESLADKESVF